MFTPTRNGAIVVIIAILPVTSAVAESSGGTKPQGCPLDVAIQQVDQFVDKQLDELSKASTSAIQEMQEINIKATKPGIAIGKQLSQQDLARFNDARHKNILIGAERLRFGEFKRDSHLIADTYYAAKLADLYRMKKEELGDASPLRFYFTILEALRVAQPRVSPTPLIDKGGCDPEGGLFFEETFAQQELAAGGADQRLVDLIFDTERLRTMYQLSWNLLSKGNDDIRATTWVGDNPETPNSVGPWIATAGTSIQKMYQVIIPYVDANLPSEVQAEVSFMQKVKQNAVEEYPTQK